MYNHLKHFIKKTIYRTGWDLHRLSPSSNPAFQLKKALDYMGINLIFDIGANTGQFAQQIRTVGYKENIVSFEPLTTAHQTLSKISVHDSCWHIHPRTAIGDFVGEVEINVAGNSVSSSILPMLEAHSSAAIGSTYIAAERAPITRLDTIAPTYLREGRECFLKIDTQGFEWQVLDGAVETLKKARGVLCELSLIQLYEGQHLWLQIIDRLEGVGFRLWAIQPGFTDLKKGRTLQVDAVFIKDQ